MKDNDFRSPLKIVRYHCRGLVRFQILYRLISLLVLFPLLIYTERLLLVFNAQTSVSAHNMMQVLKNPPTWIVLALICIQVTVFTVIEQFGSLSILHAAVSGKKIENAVAAFKEAGNRLAASMHSSSLLLMPYILLVFRFGLFGSTSSIIRFITLPGYMREDFQKYPEQGYIFYTLAVILGLFAIRLSFLFTSMVFENSSPWQAAKRSWQLTKGKNFFRLLLDAAKYALLFIASFAGFVLLCGLAIMGVILWLEPGTDPAGFITQEYIYLFAMAATVLLHWLLAPAAHAFVVSRYCVLMEEAGLGYTDFEQHPLTNVHKAVWGAVIAGMAVCVWFSGPQRWRQFRWMLAGRTESVMIMAHRGDSVQAPENTMPAFEAALEAGVSAVELDVQMTADGEIIVMHDANTRRTTGVNLNVWEADYEEIAQLDAGSWFSEKFAGTKIPTLEEVILFSRDRLFLNIEIKRNGHDEGIIDRVVEIIRENEFEDQCDITSQDYATLAEIREKYPDIMLAYTSLVGIGDIQNLEAADIISIQETFASVQNVEAIHLAGKKVFVWTVNKEETMEKLIARNVDAIITSNPRRGARVLEGHSGILDLYKRIGQILYYLS